MTIALGSDHGGFATKEAIKRHLASQGIAFTDFGSFTAEPSDYPVFGEAVATAVETGKADRGILVCTTGIGMSICANKVKGIRCALCTSVYMAEMTRRHNNANMLALGGHTVDADMALEIVERFLTTDFDGGRHLDRVRKISDYEQHI